MNKTEENSTVITGEKIEEIIHLSLYSSREESGILKELQNNEDEKTAFYAKKAIEIIEQRGGAAKDPLDYPVKIEDFDNPQTQIRMNAIKILVKERITDFLLFLIDFTGKEKDEFVKASAITAVGSLGLGDETKWISKFLTDESKTVRLSALSAMEILGNPYSIVYAIDYLKDPDSEIAKLANELLQQTTPERCQEVFLNLIGKDENSVEKAFKIMKLKNFSDEFLVTLLEKENLNAQQKQEITNKISSKAKLAPSVTEKLENIKATLPDNLQEEINKILPAKEAEEKKEDEVVPLEGKDTEEVDEIEKDIDELIKEEPSPIMDKIQIFREIADLYVNRELEIDEQPEPDSLSGLSSRLVEITGKLNGKKALLKMKEEKEVKKSSGFLEKALVGLSKFGEVTKLKLEIAQLESERDQARLSLGREIHSLYLLGNIFPHNITQILEKVRIVEEENEKLKKQKEIKKKERLEEIKSHTPDPVLKQVEKAGEVLGDIAGMAVNYTQNESLKFQVSSHKNTIKMKLRELGSHAFLRFRDGMDSYSIDTEKIQVIERLKSRVQFMEVEKEGHKQAASQSTKRTEDKNKTSGIMETLERRTGGVKTVLKIDSKISEVKKTIDMEYIELGQQLLEIYPSGEEDPKIEELKRAVKKEKEQLLKIEGDLKKLEEKISQDKLNSMLRKRKDLELQLKETTDEIIEKYGSQLAVVSINLSCPGQRDLSLKGKTVLTMLDEFSSFVVPQVEDQKGKILRKQEGEILAAFEDPEDAAKASASIMKSHSEIAETREDKESIKLGTGINLGKIFTDDDEILGDVDDISSMLGKWNPGGKIYITESFYRVLDKEKFRFENAPPYPFKKAEEPGKVFELKY